MSSDGLDLVNRSIIVNGGELNQELNIAPVMPHVTGTKN